MNVTTSGLGPNNDGCDPESCSDVLIKNCFFNNGDDCIAIKSGRNTDGRRVNVASENIIIQGCTMRNGHGGVVIGSEVSGSVRNVYTEDCVMDSPNLERALRIKTNAVRGGVIENVFLRNTRVGQVAEAVVKVDFYYEEGDAGGFTPILRNVEVKNVECGKSQFGIWIKAYERSPATGITLENCVFKNVAEPDVLDNVRNLTLLNVKTVYTVPEKSIPRDTSFTVNNTATKVLQQYPYASVVVPECPAGVAALENLVYASDGRRDLHLDLFIPEKKNAKGYPGVLLIHGGGWRSGYRQMEWPMAQHLAARGYVTATVEYRLSTEALYPTGMYDLKAAIRWMRGNAAKYNIDSKRIAVYGCSAGGELAAFLGMTGEMKNFEGSIGELHQSTRLQAVVDIDGILDFTDPAESAKDTVPEKPSAGKSWFGASFNEKPDLWREASPINYIGENTPPILFVNSSIARYHAGRDEAIEKLNRRGIYSEVHTIPDTPHPFWLFHPWFDETFGYIVTFLDKMLKST